MKTRTLPRLLPLLLMLTGCLQQVSSYAQSGSLRPGWYTIGIHGGLSYLQSDVPVRLRGYGLGVNLGKNLVHSPSGGLDIDLRGRLQYSSSYGLSPDRNYAVAGNTAIDGSGRWDYRSYPPDLGVSSGFVYNNHKTHLAELGIEALFTLGRLRERTGIVVSAYGGVGLDWTLALTDQGDAFGTDYKAAYAALDTTAARHERLRTLRRTILDGGYETLADGFADHPYGRLRFMPYWGIELGYDLTERWGIGIGHKVTYSGFDELDGYTVSGSRNDLHHYTYLQLWYRFNAGRSEDPPTIRFTDPAYSPYHTRDPYKAVTAEATNIRKPEQLRLTHNGRDIPFDFRKGRLTTEIRLADGLNTLVATAANTAGSATAETLIILDEPEQGEPVRIEFVRPHERSSTVYDPRQDIEARVRYLESLRELRFFVDGKERKDYSYDPLTGRFTGRFTAQLTLAEGDHTITLEGANRVGSDRQSVVIRYEKPVYPPQVRVISPAGQPHRTSSSSVPVELETREISHRDEIRLTYNGAAWTQFDFNASRGRITVSLPLYPGQNLLKAHVRNKAGEAAAELVVIYEEPYVPPVLRPEVRITRVGEAVYNQRTGDCQVDISAQLRHIDRREQVEITLGNQRITQFSYDPARGELSLSVRLRTGTDLLRITVRNEAGSASDQRELSCRAPEVRPRPAVSILSPAQGAIFTTAAQEILADVLHVTSREQVRLMLNGREVKGFGFDTRTGRLQQTLQLTPGENRIAVHAATDQGSAQAEVRVTLRVPRPPAVRITTPRDGSSHSKPAVTIRATTEEISRKDQVTVTLNGAALSNFQWSARETVISATLREGKNTLTVAVRNDDGRAEATVTLYYVNPVRLPAPVITWHQPDTRSGSSRVSQADLEAGIQYVTDPGGVRLLVNGKVMKDNGFDPAKQYLATQIDLQRGSNQVIIEATNQSGSVRDTVDILYEPRTGVLPPTVRILSVSRPVTDPFDPGSGQSTILAQITGVSDRSGISMRIQDQVVTDFQYDTATGRLEYRTRLPRGRVEIIVSAANAAGSRSDSTIVEF